MKRRILNPVSLLGHNADSPFVGDDYVFDFEARKTQGTHEKFPLKYQH